MNTKELLGNRIKDIFEWTKMEVNGLVHGQVFIELSNGKIVKIPCDFKSKNIETILKQDSKSLIQKSPNKFKVNSTEYRFPKDKTFHDIIKEVKIKQESTVFGRIKSIFGVNEKIPEKYTIKKTEIVDNEIKNLENFKIIDFLMFEDSDSVGYLELENGNIITETLVAPSGTGLVGLNIFQNLEDFKKHFGTEYRRLTADNKNTQTQ